MSEARLLRLYYGSVHGLAQKVLNYTRQHELLNAGDRVGVAVSGGADSVALLRLLLELRRELGIVLSVVHYNHRLRGAESDSDEEFVAALARDHRLPLHVSSGDVARHAAESRLSAETAARELRYAYFTELLNKSLDSRRQLSSREAGLDKIATGHTLDDQAETVLMRVIRGSGMTGLRAIQPRLGVEAPGEIVRPLLGVRHGELEPYLKAIGQSWREDSTNREPRFLRNRIRHQLLPLLEAEFNPSIAPGLADLAEIARGEEDYWENEAAGWLGTVIQRIPGDRKHHSQGELVQIGASHQADAVEEPVGAMLDLGWLVHEPLAVQRRAIKAAARSVGITLEFKHVEEVLRCLLQDAGRKQVALPQGWRAAREPGALVFLAPSRKQKAPGAFEYQIPLPGRAIVREWNTVVEAVQLMPGCDAAAYNPEHLFDPALLSKKLVVRNWHPGDRFWPAHSKSPKKIKELLQERHIVLPERRLWPVVACGSEIVWMRGFPGRAHFRPGHGKISILIREVPLADEEPDYGKR